VTNVHQRQRRIANLRKRIAGPQDAYERCRVYPCPHRTTADRGEGLNRLYCRRHVEFYRRHGSYVQRSYRAGQLKPYRVRALVWLKARGNDQSVRLAVAGVHRLYRAAGAPVEAFRLPGKTPTERAKAMWAQLRVQAVDPVEVIAAWMAVRLCLQDDPQADRHEEFRLVQVAKLIHRMAGGTHKRWERERPNGSIEVSELHKHPVSRGQVLRVLGREVTAVCGQLEVAD
jgi:hypothetical protein